MPLDYRGLGSVSGSQCVLIRGLMGDPAETRRVVTSSGLESAGSGLARRGTRMPGSLEGQKRGAAGVCDALALSRDR
jgi:hypothetical protein